MDNNVVLDLKQINPRKVLVINTFGLGDVLFTTPFIRNLKHAFPGLEVSYVANKRAAPLLKNDELIRHVYIYERDDFVRCYKESKAEFWRRVKTLLKEIKDEQFDVVFDFSLNTSISFFTWLSGVKYRVGFNFKNRSRFLTHSFPLIGFEGKHVVDFYLDLLPYLGVNIVEKNLKITVKDEDKNWARDFLRENQVNLSKPIIAVLPGAGASWGKAAKYRRWDAANYAYLVDKLVEKKGAQIILIGDQSDSILGAEVKELARQRFTQIFGKTTVTQLAALLNQCQLAVLNDGGPLHVAVAVGTKTVSIFGPVDEKIYGPYGSSDQHLTMTKDIACRPCYRRFRMTDCQHISCLKSITVDDVYQKIERLL